MAANLRNVKGPTSIKSYLLNDKYLDKVADELVPTFQATFGSGDYMRVTVPITGLGNIAIYDKAGGHLISGKYRTQKQLEETIKLTITNYLNFDR